MSSSIILGLTVKINKDFIDRKNGKLDEKHQENRDSIYKSMVNVLTEETVFAIERIGVS